MVNMGDVIFTLVFLVIVIVVLSIFFISLKQLKKSAKEKQIINQKLDTVLKKMDEQDKK